MKNFRNPKLPRAERIELLLRQLTLTEKISLTVHQAPAIERLGIPEYNWWNECLHGVARAGIATVFPQSIGLAATFHPTLVHRVATAISDEARAKFNVARKLGNRGQYFGLTFWTPNINLFRDPRWGRGQETYGECPFLTARLGVAFIRGLQGDHPRYLKTAACAKHYAVHSGPEPARHRFNAVVNQRDLRESYLPHFRAAVQEAKVEAVMGAYNRTNGEPCCGSPTLLQKILRDEWGFTGHVVSDCGAIDDFHAHHKLTRDAAESAALAVKNGCDLNCGCTFCKLQDAVGLGLLAEADIDRALRRLLATQFKLGLYDPPARSPWARLSAKIVNSPAHRHLARRAARESIVLLKNTGILPLRKDCRQLFVAGPNALDQTVLLGNYNGVAPHLQTVLEGILSKVSAGTQVQWTKGCDVAGDRAFHAGELGWLASYGPPIDAVIAVLGYNAFLEGEEGGTEGGDGDRHHYGLPGQQQKYLEHLKSLGKPLILVVTGGSPIDLNWAQEHCAAILFTWYPGEQGGGAIADVLFGDYNPAGRLPITFPKSYDQLPAFEDYALAGRTYRFMDAKPLYRFGDGLSYTTFQYSKLRIRGLDVSVAVKNTGKRAGDEVVQLYVSDLAASVPVPRRHLAGFQRLHLSPGQAKTVTFTLTRDQLACYDEDGRAFVEPGEFAISVGGRQPGPGTLTGVLSCGGSPDCGLKTSQCPSPTRLGRNVK